MEITDSAFPLLIERYEGGDKGGKTKCYITTELKTHCKSLCVRAFGRFAR